MALLSWKSFTQARLDSCVLSGFSLLNQLGGLPINSQSIAYIVLLHCSVVCLDYEIVFCNPGHHASPRSAGQHDEAYPIHSALPDVPFLLSKWILAESVNMSLVSKHRV